MRYLPVILILLLVGFIGFSFVGGGMSDFKFSPRQTEDDIMPIPDSPEGGKESLQLKTIKFQKCPETGAIDFLVDNSGSMSYGRKMTELQKGLIEFTSALGDKSVLGIQSFSETPKERLKFSYYKDVKSNLPTIIRQITPESATHTKDAFIFAKNKLNSALADFPKHKFALIFISDGIPETGKTNNACPGGIGGPLCAKSPTSNSCRCFAEEQEPSAVATEIKSMGVRIFTISYTDTSDAHLNDKLQTMMRSIASSPSDYYVAPDAPKISEILSQISVKLCDMIN